MEEGVPEYWIVDTDARTVARWCPAEERPAILTEKLRWQPGGMPQPLELDLPAVLPRRWTFD